MRAILLVGMMMVAGTAWAADFGVDFESANTSLTKKIRPPLTLQTCSTELCFYRASDHEIDVALGLGHDKVVETFSIRFQKNNWAIAAAYGRSIQRELMVPERDIASLDSLARGAANGVTNDENTNSISCETDQIAGRPAIVCQRK